MSRYDDIRDLLLAGYSTREVAEELGIPLSSVSPAARAGGMVYQNGLWTEPATGRVESTAFERIRDAASNIGDFFRGIIGTPEPPITPRAPTFQRDDFDFGVRDLVPGLSTQTDDGRIHMDIIVQINFKDDMYPSYAEEMQALQYDDPDLIRRMVLARIPDADGHGVDREDIKEMILWIDGEYYDTFDESDFEFNVNDEGDTP